MLWSACTAAFFGLLRASEFTCPSRSSTLPSTLMVNFVTIATDYSQATFTLPFTKTDQFGLGTTIPLFPQRSPACPVSALVHYLAHCPQDNGPLFRFHDGAFLTRGNIVDMLRAAFPSQPDLNTHSFRIGGATTLANAGIPEYMIQIMGRWTSDSFLRYIRVPPHAIRGFQGCMSMLPPDSR